MTRRATAGSLRAALAVVVLLSAVAFAPTAAQTPIGGDQLGNVALTNAGSPYVVTSDVVVLNGATLSIEAGVTVYVDPGVNIIIRSGRLRSQGTDASPVIITSSADNGMGTPAPGDWGGLIFETGTNDIGTELEWTEMRYGTGVVLQAASPTFESCTISFMSGPAIAMDLDSFPKGEGNAATDNALNGVQVPAGDITAPGRWELKGIPFVLMGRVSVGQSPTLTGIVPNTVQQLDTVDVVLSGQRLDGATDFVVSGTGITPTVQPGGTPTSQTVQLVVDETAPLGARSFSLVTPAGTASGDDAGLTLTVVGPTPVLLAISPDTVVAGQGNFTMTVNGQRFATGVEVLVDATPQSTTRLSDTQLTADVDGALIAAAGSLDVLVRNPDPGNPGMFLESVPMTLTVEAPQITLTPDPLNVISGEVANLILSTPLVAPSGGFIFDVSSSNTAVATVPAQVTVPQGSSSVPVPVTGGTTGSATITATRLDFLDGMAQADVVPPPVFFDVAPVVAPRVGVVVTEPPDPTPDLSVNPQLAPEVGVVLGAAVFSIAPDRAERGSTNVLVTANGVDLGAVTTVAFEPPDDITVNGSPTVAPDGSSVTVDISIAGSAEPTVRKVLLQTASATVPPAGPGANHFLVTRPAPQIQSLSPVIVLPGTIHTLTVRGIDLHDATSIQASPPDDLTFGPVPVVNGSGTEATIELQVGAAAALGPRVITITTPGGTSSASSEPANTLNVVDDLGTPFTPLTAPRVGVVVTEPTPPDPDLPVEEFRADDVGVVVGAAITGLTPGAANIGSTGLDVTIEGVGLDAATGVSFEPPDDITINGAPTIAPDGLTIVVNIDIDTAAATGLRTVNVATATGTVPAAGPFANRFNVTFPPPQISSVVPNRGLVGTSVPIAINGVDLNGATAVTFEPPGGLALAAAPVVNGAGTQITGDLIIDAGAALGLRTVRVTTPGGVSTATQSPANAFEVTDQVGTLITPLTAPRVGVVVTETPPPDPGFAVTTLAAARVGVVVTETPPPDPDFAVEELQAPAVGVVVGTATTGVSPTTAEPGAVNVDVTVQGIALDAATGVQFMPSDGITVNGAPTVAPDGLSVTANISLAIDAPRSLRQVQVLLPSGPARPAKPGDDLLFVGTPPDILSIDPNTVAIGSSFTLTINGTDLDTVTSVDFLPPDDILLGTPVANGAGTQITIPVVLGGTITAGARVVTVTTLAGTSTTTASAANTMTIVGSMSSLSLPPGPLDLDPDKPEPTRMAAARPRSVRPGPVPQVPATGGAEPLELPDAVATLTRTRDAAMTTAQRTLAALSGLAPTTETAGLPERAEPELLRPYTKVSLSHPLLARPPTSASARAN